MSEPTTEAIPEGTESEAENQGNPGEEALGDAGKQALDRMKVERNEAKQSAAALQKQLDTIAAANLSDLERAQKQAADAEAAVTQAQAEALRYRIAAKHSITDDDAELFLTGTDEETLTRQAARLVERTPATTAPRADLTQGGSGGTSGSSDPATAFAAFMADQ